MPPASASSWTAAQVHREGKVTIMSKLSDIELQVMWNRLIAVVEEQAQVLLRTAFSPDRARRRATSPPALFDLRGQHAGPGGHRHARPRQLHGRLASRTSSAKSSPSRPCSRAMSTSPTIPWMGTGHLNDFVLTTPAFHKGRLVALFSCTSHLMDIGGIGFGPDGTDVFMEGLYIPLLKLAEARAGSTRR
jgi:N-methylhydantoinase B